MVHNERHVVTAYENRVENVAASRTDGISAQQLDAYGRRRRQSELY
jgi:hypothetical protein